MTKFITEKKFLFFLSLFNLLLRIIRIDSPPVPFLDEKYYILPVARSILSGQGDTMPVQPPSAIGKHLFAASLKIFGENPFGWRITTVISGTVSVILTYYLAKIMFKNRFIASVASCLLTFDFMLFVHSRYADLETLLLASLLLSFVIVWKLFNETKIRWVFLLGLSLGLSISVKLQALLPFTSSTLFILIFANYKLRTRLVYFSIAVTVSLGLYFSSFLILTANKDINQVGPLFKFFRYYHTVWWPQNALKFLSQEGYNTQRIIEISPIHRYPLTWLSNPTDLYYENIQNGKESAIIDSYNPAIFFPGLAAFFAACYLILKNKDKRLIFLVLTSLFLYLPWLISSLIKPLLYNQYYILPAIPLFSILIAFFCEKIYKKLPSAVFIYLIIVILFFIAFYPLISALPVSSDYFKLLTRFK